MTYSVLGYDASNGDLGVAVQSKFPGVGSLRPPESADGHVRGLALPESTCSRK